jgi:hypothetical protein
VTSEDLARSCLAKARVRLKALAVMRDEGGHSDVVREAQELVELALKGMLRAVGSSRRDRELAFYGDIDFIPTERYSAIQGRQAYDDAAWILALAERAISRPTS